jgi:GT2 family glycosyltransferase
VSATATREAIETSRQLLLQAIGHPRDLTLVGITADRGDELSYAGAQSLLADRIYREVGAEQLCQATGDTVLLGCGAFTRPLQESLPRALAVATQRFARVIVLPSHFDVSEDRVRDALGRSRATVFASDPESHRRVQPLCRCKLAHDCAFFFSFEGHAGRGEGILNAFRSDRQDRELPHDNDDISLTAPDLETWLSQIAAHELVRTDRSAVMIAAARMGKQVEFADHEDDRLAALVGFALTEESVQSISPLAPRALPAAPPRRRLADPPRVTAVLLTRDRPHRALAAIDSLSASREPIATLLIDNNSTQVTAAMLRAGCDEREAVTLRRSERNLGCAGGRRAAVAQVRSELVLFLDDDAELAPGALDVLVAELDSHPETAAVTATVSMDDGIVHHSGGSMAVEDRVIRFALIGAGRSIEELPVTGEADWVPGTAVLVRRSVLDEFPIDEGMRSYFEDNDWCYRIERARPGSFRRSLEARAVHHFTEKHRPGVDFASRSVAVELLAAHAHFYARHAKILDLALFDLVPELRDAHGVPDLGAARLLLELVSAKGADWTFMAWMNGDLEPLILRGRQLTALADENSEQADKLAEDQRVLSEHQELFAFLFERHETLERVEAGGWWRLRGRLMPLVAAASRLRGTLTPLASRLRGKRRR